MLRRIWLRSLVPNVVKPPLTRLILCWTIYRSAKTTPKSFLRSTKQTQLILLYWPVVTGQLLVRVIPQRWLRACKNMPKSSVSSTKSWMQPLEAEFLSGFSLKESLKWFSTWMEIELSWMSKPTKLVSCCYSKTKNLWVMQLLSKKLISRITCWMNILSLWPHMPQMPYLKDKKERMIPSPLMRLFHLILDLRVHREELFSTQARWIRLLEIKIMIRITIKPWRNSNTKEVSRSMPFLSESWNIEEFLSLMPWLKKSSECVLSSNPKLHLSRRDLKLWLRKATSWETKKIRQPWSMSHEKWVKQTQIIRVLSIHKAFMI